MSRYNSFTANTGHPASDDKLVTDGTTNGTRTLDASKFIGLGTASIKTTTYTIVAGDSWIVGNHATTPFTVTGLAASSNTNKALLLSNKNAAAVTFDFTSMGTIDGVNTIVLKQYDSYLIKSDGTIWKTLACNLPSQASVALAAATAIDCSLGNVFTKTLSANTTFTFSNFSDGQTIIVEVLNTASNYTVTWPTARWTAGAQPTQTVGAKYDTWTFVKTSTGINGSVVPNMS